jgi:hypothetical protein
MSTGTGKVNNETNVTDGYFLRPPVVVIAVAAVDVGFAGSVAYFYLLIDDHTHTHAYTHARNMYGLE